MIWPVHSTVTVRNEIWTMCVRNETDVTAQFARAANALSTPPSRGGYYLSIQGGSPEST